MQKWFRERAKILLLVLVFLFLSLSACIQANVFEQKSINESINDRSDSLEIMWSIPDRGFTESERVLALDVVQKILDDSSGWVQAGIIFKRSPHLELSSGILLNFFESWDNIRTFCKEPTARACARIYKGANLFGNQGYCGIVLPVELFRDWYPHPVSTYLLNHEVGHCLGLGDSKYKDDVTFVRNDFSVVYPSVREIDFVKRKIKSGK